MIINNFIDLLLDFTKLKIIFQMNINGIWQRFTHIFFRPKVELEEIRGETGLMGEAYLSLFIFCFLLGLSNIRTGILNVVSETAVWYVATLIATFATWSLAPKFAAVTTWAKSLKMNIFVVLPILLCIMVANVIGYRLVLLIAGLIYSVYLLYFGIKIIFMPKEQQEIPYTLTALLVGALSNYIARVLIP
ncbi:MAG: hypothetical protein LBL90_02030 [Prevotellaceae bacterium]|jgi:uncharacterized membrane protein YfcA|nr:hypothetical protein [Prevotellaceae bacterium]